MNYTDLIQRLRETSRALDALAEHLSELENHDQDSELQELQDQPTDRQDDRPNDQQAAVQAEAQAQPQAANPPKQVKSPLANMLGNILRGPNNGNPGLPGLSGMLGGMPGIDMQNMPKSLEELQANPQLMAMLNSVRGNPQMLNMLSSLSGLDSNQIMQALQSIQPQGGPTATPAQSAAATADILRATPAPAMSAMQMPQPQQQPQASSSGYLNSLLKEWRWQPYARVWSV